EPVQISEAQGMSSKTYDRSIGIPKAERRKREQAIAETSLEAPLAGTGERSPKPHDQTDGIPEQLKSIPAYLGKPLNDLVCWCSAPSLGKGVQRHMTEASESPRPNAGNESRPSPRPVYEPPLPE